MSIFRDSSGGISREPRCLFLPEDEIKCGKTHKTVPAFFLRNKKREEGKVNQYDILGLADPGLF